LIYYAQDIDEHSDLPAAKQLDKAQAEFSAALKAVAEANRKARTAATGILLFTRAL
jgi:hypothetical protein